MENRRRFKFLIHAPAFTADDIEVRLRDLCAQMHAFYREAGVSALQQAQFRAEHLPVRAMLPHEAQRGLVQSHGRRAARRGGWPHRGHAVAGLSARHRDDRAG